MAEDIGNFTTDKGGFCIIDFGGNEVWEGKYSDETKSLCNRLNNLYNENRELKAENLQLKQELFETSKELLWATSDEVDRALHYEDEVEELRKEIFE